MTASLCFKDFGKTQWKQKPSGCTCSFVASDVFPGKFLLQPMDFGSCLGFTASNSMPRHRSCSHWLHEVGTQE